MAFLVVEDSSICIYIHILVLLKSHINCFPLEKYSYALIKKIENFKYSDMGDIKNNSCWYF